MASSYPYYNKLREKWINRHKSLQTKLWEKHQDALSWASSNLPIKQFVATSLGGILFISAPNIPLLPKPPVLLTDSIMIPQELDKETRLMLDLKGLIPSEVRPLSEEEEVEIAKVLTRDFGFNVTSSLYGKRLNRTYGLIGSEQHLALFPGDNIYTHFENEKDYHMFGNAGMANGLGAWRYFAKSRETLTQQDILREKFYIAAPTFLAEGFDANVAGFRKFFKYRKMLVVNPENGKAIVCNIADAGPSPWTGKHLGGSPEIMDYLKRVDGAEVGPVLYFFTEDDSIPLGPVEIL